MRELPADSGEVILAKGTTIGYLAQHEAVSSGNTIYEELLEVKRDLITMEETIRSMELEMKTLQGDALTQLLESYNRLSTEFEHRDGYAYQSELAGVLKGLGFKEEEFSKKVETLSGGQKTRNSIAWLETYLLSYPGAVIIVAHDRYFLNRVVTKVVEIDNGYVTTFSGNYSAYAEKKKQLRDNALKAWMNQQQEIKHQQEVITKLKSFNREKSIKRAESREKMLEKIEVLEKPVEINDEIRIKLEPRTVSGNDVLTVEGLSKSFGENHLFTSLTFEIKRGERVAVIGNNGTGKTTLLKIINQVLPADTGRFTLGSKVKIGYYDQEHHVLHMEKTMFEELSDAYPTLTNTQIRNVLAAFLFTGDDVFKRISDLSGGERGRVSLAKLMLSEANFIILDEPTNHLDITSKEILENALNNYTGTVLYVSHDRYFINQTATRILELTGNTLVNYIGNYDYYLEKKEELTQIYAPQAAEAAGTEKASVAKLSWQQKKEEQALLRKKQNELKKTEARIHELETRDSEIDALMEDEEVFTDVAKCIELSTEKAVIAEELEVLYEMWETLAE